MLTHLEPSAFMIQISEGLLTAGDRAKTMEAPLGGGHDDRTERYAVGGERRAERGEKQEAHLGEYRARKSHCPSFASVSSRTAPVATSIRQI